MAVTIAASPNNFLVGPGNSPLPVDIGAQKVVFCTILADAAYPTGGYTLDPALFNLNVIDVVIVPTQEIAGVLALLDWNPTTRKLQAFNNLGAEIANNGNLSTLALPVIVAGN